MILHPNFDDKFDWQPDPTRVFTVKSCSNLLVDAVPTEPLCDTLSSAFRNLWRLNIPSKIMIFGWRVLLNRVPTKDNIFAEKTSSKMSVICRVYYA